MCVCVCVCVCACLCVSVCDYIYVYIYIFISDVLLWTPAYRRAKAGRPARTYMQQLCEDAGCGPEDLPEGMNNREKWRQRVRDVRTIILDISSCNRAELLKAEIFFSFNPICSELN